MELEARARGGWVETTRPQVRRSERSSGVEWGSRRDFGEGRKDLLGGSEYS